MQSLHLQQMFCVGRGREKIGGQPGFFIQQKNGLALFAKVHIKLVFFAGNPIEPQYLLQLFRNTVFAFSESIVSLTIDFVVGRPVFFASPPHDMTVVGFQHDAALFGIMPQCKFGRIVVAKDLQRRDNRALATVVGAYQHIQPLGQIEDRVLMRHKVDKFNPFYHSLGSQNAIGVCSTNHLGAVRHGSDVCTPGWSDPSNSSPTK